MHFQLDFLVGVQKLVYQGKTIMHYLGSQKLGEYPALFRPYLLCPQWLPEHGHLFGIKC